LKGCELGLSGGIDSALMLAFANNALGKDKIHALMMPYYGNSNLDDAIALARNFGIDYSILGIKDIHDAFIKRRTEKRLIKKGKTLYQDWNKDITSQNLMARIRMCMLYAEANEHDRIVLGTCNMSEIYVGYCTKHGDAACDIEPMGNLPKRGVYEMAKFWNDTHPDGPKIPEAILTKAPSADLIPGQTDEADIGPYEILDNYIENVFGNKSHLINNRDAQRILKLNLKTEHKRNMPPMPTIPFELITGDKDTKISSKDFVNILRTSLGTLNATQFRDLAASFLDVIDE